MRPFFAILIACLLLGGTYAYTQFAASVRHSPIVFETKFADDKYSVEIRRTFPSAPVIPVAEAIAEIPVSQSALKLVFKGRTVIDRKEAILAAEVVRVADLSDVEVGLNELFVSSNVDPFHQEFAALNVRVIKNNFTLAESTFTNEPGSTLVYGVVVFEVRTPQLESHAH